MTETMDTVNTVYHIYTDGACKRSKHGGWGYSVIANDNEVYCDFGGDCLTTNNKMELTAMIEALKFILGDSQTEYIIYSDSHYTLKSIVRNANGVLKFKNGKPVYTGWMKSWEENGWVKPNLNRNYIFEMDRLLNDLAKTEKHITLRWVKGHSNDIGNDRADELANCGVEEAKANERSGRFTKSAK